MKDQHEKIKGYRDLSQSEIDLMNEIKAKAEEVNLLIVRLEYTRHRTDPMLGQDSLDESYRCIEISKEKLQTGFMWLVRAVALPNSF